MTLESSSYLCAFGGCGTHGPAEDLLNDIWQQADCNEQDDAEPGRTTGQHLHEHVVHPLVVQEGPEQKQDTENDQIFRNILINIKVIDDEDKKKSGLYQIMPPQRREKIT